MPAAGQTMLYRPVPADFAETFVRVGWSGIEKYYNANWRTVKRWLAISGEDALRMARADYVKRNGYNRRGYGE